MATARDFPVELAGLIDQRLYRRLEQLFNLVYALEQSQREVPTQAAAAVTRQLQLLGIYREPLLGNEVADPQLASVAAAPGTGTVTAITAGGGLSGGTITVAGTITLIIGSTNVVQKSNGTQLVNSLITDTGTLINLSTVATVDRVNGLFILDIGSLPVVDPGVPGALWNNGGVINVSP